MRLIVAALAALALLITPAGAARRRAAEMPPNAGGLVDNVNGYTLDGAGQVQRFTGLLIDKQGKVIRLLRTGEPRPDRLDFRLDARGRTAIPGLIDAHGHIMALGFGALQLDLSDTSSLAEAQQKLRRYAADHPNLRWIVGFGWNQEKWGLGRFPTAADLDVAVADRPVYLERIDGHAVVVNGAALAAAGVTAQTAVPEGGRMEVAGGRPTGLFVDAARAIVDRARPGPQPREREAAFAAAQLILMRNGVTSVADMGTSVADWLTIRRSGDAGNLRVRIIAYAAGIDALLTAAGTGPTPWLYDGRLRMIGVKLYADGALGSRGAFLKADYADAPGQRGLRLLEDAQMRNLISRAAMEGFQVAIHAIGDGANAQALDAFEEVAETYKGDRRWRIEHAQIVDPTDIPRFGRSGIIASMQPVHATSDWRMAEARLGPNRLAGAYAWRSMLEAGARLAFGSDFPVESPNPFAGLAAAITRETGEGQPPGGWLPAQRLTLQEALAAFTTGAAYSAFAEDRIGSLQPGRYADFLLLDRDIMTAAPAELRGTQVLETWIGGKRAWSRGNP